MKQGRALPELANELERQACAKRDYLAEAETLCLHSNGRSHLILGGLDQTYPMLPTAHQQVANYLGIPKPFYDRLLKGTEDLRVPVAGENGHDHLSSAMGDIPDTPLVDVLANCLFAAKGTEKRLVRTLDGQARAFLSDSYNVDLDNHDVFRVAAKALQESDFTPDDVVSCEVTERRLYLKVVTPKLEAVVRPGDARENGMLREPQVVRAGFVLSNSETGLGSLAVQPLVYKLMCENGWIREEGFRRRHLGKALESEEDGTLYRSDTRLAEAKARLLKVRDHISAALDEARFMETVALMQESAETPITGNVEKGVEATAARFGLSQSEKESVLRNLIEGADLSIWGISNAVTATAKYAKDYDRATELEAIGGRFLSLTRAEAREITQA